MSGDFNSWFTNCKISHIASLKKTAVKHLHFFYLLRRFRVVSHSEKRNELMVLCGCG